MTDIKKKCTFSIWIAVLVFLLFSTLISYYIFLPTLKNVSTLNDLCVIPASWPYLPKWAVITIGFIPIAAALWMIGVLVKIRLHIISPLAKTDVFLGELANNKIPSPLLMRNKYGRHTNQMIANLNMIRDRIINNNRQRDAVEQRKSADRDKLDYANELKSLMISRLTPDIRMPLNSIGGYAEILKKKSAPGDVFKNELDGIARNVVSVSKIVSRIISLSKIGHQQMEINPSHFRTAELIDNVIRSNDDLLQEREVSIVNIFDSSMPSLLYTDHELLTQSLLMIVRALIRASENGETVNICCSMDDEKVYFNVRDCAARPCREKLAELYKYHEDDCASEYLDEASSTLLGVFFASSLAEYIGGELKVSSSERSYNSFTLVFNKFDILSAENEDELRKQGIYVDLHPASAGNLVVGKNYLPGSLSYPNVPQNMPARRILIGEDNEDNANALCSYLALFNFESVCCDNAQQLLDTAQKEDFDALILSNSMRHKYLLEIIKILRRRQDKTQLPIIVLVSKLNPRKESELQALKVSSVLLKPVSFSALVNRLNQLCS